MKMNNQLQAGAAAVDITPKTSLFLHGYPHVKRYSTGVHDPLMSSALYLTDGSNGVMFIANDILLISKDLAARARKRVAEATNIPADHILVSVTHTHSGPITVDYISNEGDPVVPKADADYLRFFEDGIVEAGVQAYQSAQPAEVGLGYADGGATGTNRRDPNGPSDPQVPVLAVRKRDDKTMIALMLVCSMHPTVLHEDSTRISGDFPGLARQYLQNNVVGENCPVLHHTGPAGNQSPRRVVTANTFDEARRLGEALGTSVAEAIRDISYISESPIHACQDFIELPRRPFPPVEEAERNVRAAVERLEQLRNTDAPRAEVRTAECDWYGAEETLTLARAEAQGRLQAVASACMPAEVLVLRVGPWSFAGWQGEVFVEYALAVKTKHADTFVISLANGELQGYIVTPEAAAEGGYEASNALFAPESGDLFVEKTDQLLQHPRE
ncbi:MAG: neutral/alkaline non-lysosomal ceramidase N-terminal domain-containing protein [Phycisphaerae bacterium]|nr:neutral/alkaline non-lysosomal ceramidase N-terminal domain-containing protein [Phycisphaerae bacterium]